MGNLSAEQKRKYTELSSQINAVQAHLSNLETLVSNEQAIDYAALASMNADISAMMARAANASWE